jgi:hypothetical protein
MSKPISKIIAASIVAALVGQSALAAESVPQASNTSSAKKTLKRKSSVAKKAGTINTKTGNTVTVAESGIKPEATATMSNGSLDTTASQGVQAPASAAATTTTTTANVTPPAAKKIRASLFMNASAGVAEIEKRQVKVVSSEYNSLSASYKLNATDSVGYTQIFNVIPNTVAAESDRALVALDGYVSLSRVAGSLLGSNPVSNQVRFYLPVSDASQKAKVVGKLGISEGISWDLSTKWSAGLNAVALSTFKAKGATGLLGIVAGTLGYSVNDTVSLGFLVNPFYVYTNANLLGLTRSTEQLYMEISAEKQATKNLSLGASFGSGDDVYNKKGGLDKKLSQVSVFNKKNTSFGVSGSYRF